MKINILCKELRDKQISESKKQDSNIALVILFTLIFSFE